MNRLTDYLFQAESSPTLSFPDRSSPKQQARVDQFIQDNYVLISNVSNLSEAQIICLGENHFNQTDKQINAQVIDQFYEKNSILLVEEATRKADESLGDLNAFHEEMRQKYQIEKSIDIDGWDIEFDNEQFQELKRAYMSKNIFENPKPTHFINSSKVPGFNDDLKDDQLIDREQNKSLLSSFCTSCCTALFIKSCRPCIKKHYKKETIKALQKIINRVPARNQNMRDTIQHTSHIYRKVFVIAGCNHFTTVDKKIDGVDYTAEKNSLRQTIEFLKTKKFAILIPRSEIEEGIDIATYE